MKKLILLGCALVSACATSALENSVPTQAGHNMASARNAVLSCSNEADIGGNAAVIGAYPAFILMSSPLVGSVLAYGSRHELRAQGEMDQVDRCLSERGFDRRVLTQGEAFWLRNAYGEERVRRLDHLVAGGTVENYAAPQS